MPPRALLLGGLLALAPSTQAAPIVNVPEPSTLALLGLGLLVVAALHRRRTRARDASARATAAPDTDRAP